MDTTKRTNKFIVIGDRIELGMAEYHKDLCLDPAERTSILGGGKWARDTVNKTLLLYGVSFEFGKLDKHQIIGAIEMGLPPQFDTYTIYYSFSHTLPQARITHRRLGIYDHTNKILV